MCSQLILTHLYHKEFSIPIYIFAFIIYPKINSSPAPFTKAIMDFNHFALCGRNLFNSNLRFSGCLTLSSIFIFPHTEYPFSHFLTVRIRRFVSKDPNPGYALIYDFAHVNITPIIPIQAYHLSYFPPFRRSWNRWFFFFPYQGRIIPSGRIKLRIRPDLWNNRNPRLTR